MPPPKATGFAAKWPRFICSIATRSVLLGAHCELWAPLAAEPVKRNFWCFGHKHARVKLHRLAVRSASFFFFFGCFLMTKMPQMTYLHIQRSLRVTPQKQTCDDSLLLTWGVTCGSLEFFCSIQLCIHMPVKGFYRQPACLLFCVCACCLIGSAELLRGQQSPVPGGVLWAGTRSWASQQEPCPGLPALLSLLLSRSTQAFLAPPSASREPAC